MNLKNKRKIIADVTIVTKNLTMLYMYKQVNDKFHITLLSVTVFFLFIFFNQIIKIFIYLTKNKQ
jgi:hypothetical protein